MGVGQPPRCVGPHGVVLPRRGGSIHPRRGQGRMTPIPCRVISVCVICPRSTKEASDTLHPAVLSMSVIATTWPFGRYGW